MFVTVSRTIKAINYKPAYPTHYYLFITQGLSWLMLINFKKVFQYEKYEKIQVKLNKFRALGARRGRWVGGCVQGILMISWTVYNNPKEMFSNAKNVNFYIPIKL